jgi:NOL1/NOP2/fmu family ribosome biogenesis protein
VRCSRREIYTLTKWGYSNVVVTQNDAADFSRLPGFFDVIVVDAPCSGEGLFRKQPDAVQEWSEDAVANCAVRQTGILDNIYDSLKEGGFLIYSTCTFEAAENENQCRRLIEKYGMVPVQLNAGVDGVVTSDPGLRFYPHLIKGEGFFIAALRKTEAVPTVNFRIKQSNTSSEIQYLKTHIDHPENFVPYKKNDELYAFPKALHQDILLLMDRLYVRKAGLHLCTIRGKDLVPDHELALSLDLNSGITRVELSKEEAIKYLRCESIFLQDIPKGWAVVTYRNFPLGWIKGIGNRINNYFPRSLRILMAG